MGAALAGARRAGRAGRRRRPVLPPPAQPRRGRRAGDGATGRRPGRADRRLPPGHPGGPRGERRRHRARRLARHARGCRAGDRARTVRSRRAPSRTRYWPPSARRSAAAAFRSVREVHEAFHERWGAAQTRRILEKSDPWRLDLQTANLIQLREAGVRTEQRGDRPALHLLPQGPLLQLPPRRPPHRPNAQLRYGR